MDTPNMGTGTPRRDHSSLQLDKQSTTEEYDDTRMHEPRRDDFCLHLDDSMLHETETKSTPEEYDRTPMNTPHCDDFTSELYDPFPFEADTQLNLEVLCEHLHCDAKSHGEEALNVHVNRTVIEPDVLSLLTGEITSNREDSTPLLEVSEEQNQGEEAEHSEISGRGRASSGFTFGTKIQEADIICGRATKQVELHKGNRWFRVLVSIYRPLYKSSFKKHHKTLIVDTMLREIAFMGGRFVEKVIVLPNGSTRRFTQRDPASEAVYREASRKVINEKVRKAMRRPEKDTSFLSLVMNLPVISDVSACGVLVPN